MGFVKAANRFCLSIFTIYAAEVFPTCVRSLGSGIIFSLSLIGSVLSPFIVNLAELLNNISPIALVGCLSSIGLLMFWFFKETLNKPLKDQISEIYKSL